MFHGKRRAGNSMVFCPLSNRISVVAERSSPQIYCNVFFVSGTPHQQLHVIENSHNPFAGSCAWYWSLQEEADSVRDSPRKSKRATDVTCLFMAVGWVHIQKQWHGMILQHRNPGFLWGLGITWVSPVIFHGTLLDWKVDGPVEQPDLPNWHFTNEETDRN